MKMSRNSVTCLLDGLEVFFCFFFVFFLFYNESLEYSVDNFIVVPI